MPAPRKSCERCRAQKARCIWTEDFTECAKCRRSGHPCSPPEKTTPPQIEGSLNTAGCAAGSGLSWQLDLSTPDITSGAFSGIPSGDASYPTPPTPGASQFHSGPSVTSAHPINNESLRQPIPSASSLISVPAAKASSVPRLPSQLPRVEGSCGTNNCYLPPAEDGHVLLQEYLHDYNSKIPLYSPESLYYLFRDCYAGTANERPLAWVLVSTTIGMTYRLRAMSVFAAPDDTDQAEYYLSRCLRILPDLLIQPPCIRLVQACISIAWLLETSDRCERAPFFASTALRLATVLGYNDLAEETVTSVDDLEKRHVFWLAFFIHTHFAFAEQMSGLVRLVDISTPIPAANVSNWWDLGSPDSNNQSSLNIFSLHCSLAVLETEAAEELFSVQARRRYSDNLRAAACRMLDKLAIWRQANALSHLDANDVARVMYRSDIVVCVVLESAYFRTLYQLQAARALSVSKDKTDPFGPETLRAMMQVDNGPCVDEARRFLGLAVMMPQGNLSTTWYAMRPMAAAFCIMLSPRNFDPSKPDLYRKRELRLGKSVLDAFDAATQGRDEAPYNATIAFCREVYAIATKL